MSIARDVLAFGRATSLPRFDAIVFEKPVRAITVGVGAVMSVPAKFVGTAAEAFVPRDAVLLSGGVPPGFVTKVPLW